MHSCTLAALRLPGSLAPSTQHARAELERMSYSNYYFDRRDPRRPRFCKRCQAWKPERAHHCSVSGRCVLKMVRGMRGQAWASGMKRRGRGIGNAEVPAGVYGCEYWGLSVWSGVLHVGMCTRAAGSIQRW